MVDESADFFDAPFNWPLGANVLQALPLGL